MAFRTECPAALFFICIAALWSRCRLHPPLGQWCQRSWSFLGTLAPQLEQCWLVPDAFTGIPNKPAFSALFVSIDRKHDQPASSTDLARLERESPLPFKSSTAITSYILSRVLAVLMRCQSCRLNWLWVNSSPPKDLSLTQSE